ncbi:DUF2634 domain-containing protein [Acetobacterium wieringae]|uniref:DUF2634 domain-containing protein n=1 Tax=Acetobacterium wieringae TaxID=52694 RepID=UPI0020346E0A|nr:DUF2634 domain-containing protein [Acetobacterium wieringae]URN85882.1 DUF2634 domain-containing protein [Acetobacterium wieringae]
MRTFKLIDGDIVFDNNGELVMVEGKEEEAQSLERIFSANVREFFLDPDHGFDFDLLKTKRPDKNLIRLGLIAAATQDDRVKTVTATTIEFDNSARSLAIGFKIITKTGNTIESEVRL